MVFQYAVVNWAWSSTHHHARSLTFHTFDSLIVEVEYEIYETQIEGFLLGVAIYTADRKRYIFGPNTHLDNIKIPNKKGVHKICYEINCITLIQGQYVLDVGIFNNEGIVNIDYRISAAEFSISNKYFSEGDFYMEHNWKIIQ